MIYTKHMLIAMPVALLTMMQTAQAQRHLTNSDSAWFKEKIEFIRQAPEILSASIKQKNWNDLNNFAANWKISESPSNEIILAIQLLSFIQNRQFFVMRLPADYLRLLEYYASEMNASGNDNHFKYYIDLAGVYRYDATSDAIKIFRTLSAWAHQLRSSAQLSKTEIFFCEVFEGNISHPEKSLKNDENAYNDLTAFNNYLQHQISHCDSLSFVNQRSSRTGTAGIMLGTWIPTGNAALLGNAFSFGFLFGYRNKKNEYDAFISLRVPHGTNQFYNVYRSDSLFSSNYYDGGYFGFDYTRYFVHKRRYEIGFTSAIGFDYFDFTGTSSDSLAGKRITPTAIGSFDLSNGIRFKYFLRPGLYIGIAAKYHLINYCNTGGTDLGGNAFTIDLILGSH